jgi:hypothetical protein
MAQVVYNAVTEIPEALRNEYVERNGKMVLKIEGDVAAAGLAKQDDLNAANNRLIEFRDNNARLMRELGVQTIDAAVERIKVVKDIDPIKLAAVKDIDPEEYRKLKEKVQQFENKGMKEDTDINKIVHQAVTTAITPLQQRLDTSERERKEAREKLADKSFRQTISEAALKAGAKPNAVDFIIEKARDKFTVEDDHVKAKPNQFSSAKPGDPLSVDEWLLTAMKEYDYAFQPSGGGGSQGDGQKGGVRREGKTLVFQGGQVDPRTLGAHMDEIAEGKVKVQVSG